LIKGHHHAPQAEDDDVFSDDPNHFNPSLTGHPCDMEE